MQDFLWFSASALYDLIIKWPVSFVVTPDFVPFIIVQKTAPVICGPLANLSNQSLTQGEVPSRWFLCYTHFEEGAIIQSRKLSLFKKVLRNQINRHIHLNHIISNHQHGVVPGRSVECLNDWTETLYNKTKSRVPSCSQKVDIRISFRQDLLGPKLTSPTAMFRQVLSGVPQVYADDLKIYKTISHDTDYLVVQKAIDVTVDWSKKWQLPIAPQKTVYMKLDSGNL
ncbi:hypothetical protein COOONC_17952 [Cooperia oncophora]